MTIWQIATLILLAAPVGWLVWRSGKLQGKREECTPAVNEALRSFGLVMMGAGAIGLMLQTNLTGFLVVALGAVAWLLGIIELE